MNASSIIGALLQGGMSGSTGNRIQNAMGGQGIGGLGDMLDQVMGGAASSHSNQESAGLAGGADLGSSDQGGILSKLAGSQGGGAAASGLGGLGGGLADMASGALGNLGRTVKDSGNAGAVGALVGSLLGGGGGAMKGALGGGALALLGSVALKAFQNTQQPDQNLTGDHVPNAVRAMTDDNYLAHAEADSEIILKAMISAAKADGVIDASEQQRLLGKLDEAGADSKDRQTFASAIQAPLDLDRLVAEVRTPAMAAQIYAASLLAIEIDTDAERHYLRDLAGRLRLNSQEIANLHQAVGAPL